MSKDIDEEIDFDAKRTPAHDMLAALKLMGLLEQLPTEACLVILNRVRR